MHISVLKEETIKYLNLREDSLVVDMTVGYAGHSSEILSIIKKGYLYAFDQDDDAIEHSKNKLSQIGDNFKVIKNNFKNAKLELNSLGINKVDAILFDLGVSSPQLDEKDRGFSFHQDAILDMRMDKNNKLDAKYVVNNLSEEELTNIFFKYGEEKYSRGIARKICEKRIEKEINTTLELVEIIKEGVPEKYKREKHPARKVFQAIRIYVNQELEVFETAIEDAIDLLNVGGRVAVITFHSLEDRLCKEIFNEYTKIDKSLNKLPIIPEEYLPDYKIVKVITPSNKELEDNNRSRSATLRILEKIK
jgi:16S rRNA (cytosine1402-N4)-methyltransferase